MKEAVSVLMLGGGGNLPSQLLGEDLHPVAYAQYRQMAFIDIGWCQRGIRLVNTGWASGEDKSLGVQRGYLFPGGIMRY
ncbi:hypothetical protein ES703_120545 [subsurface metagenome]